MQAKTEERLMTTSTQNTSISVAQYLRSRLRAGAIGLTLASIASTSVCAAAVSADGQQETPKRQAVSKQAGSKQESIGVGTGFVVGAVAGGPVGAIVGAAAGAWLGDRYHKQSVTNSSLKTDLSKSEADRARLEQNVSELQSTLAELQTDVKFRTNDTSVDTQAMSPLLKLGSIAASMPDVKVRVAGYADPRGSDKLNDALSQERAEAVAAVLESAGVSKDQMIVEGHGKSEATTQDGDMDGYAFDRRVTVKLERAGTEQKVARRD
jgi:outer membrane protein OmpA-like peptidoglycan-associated protein